MWIFLQFFPLTSKLYLETTDHLLHLNTPVESQYLLIYKLQRLKDLAGKEKVILNFLNPGLNCQFFGLEVTISLITVI